MKNEIILLAQETGTSINFWLQVKRKHKHCHFSFYGAGVFQFTSVFHNIRTKIFIKNNEDEQKQMTRKILLLLGVLLRVFTLWH